MADPYSVSRRRVLDPSPQGSLLSQPDIFNPPPQYVRDDVLSSPARRPLQPAQPEYQPLSDRQAVRRHLTSAFFDHRDDGPSDPYTTMPLGRGQTGRLEEGVAGERSSLASGDSSNPEEDDLQDAERTRGGVLDNIIQLYHDYRGSSQGNGNDNGSAMSFPRDATPWPQSIATSRQSSMNSETLRMRPGVEKRSVSMMSGATDGDIFDDDDPRITGLGKNNIDEKVYLGEREKEKERQTYYGVDEKKRDKGASNLTPEQEEEKALLERQVRSTLAKQKFVLRLAKALMLYGAPSHRLESQILATARVLALPAQVIIWPGVALISFQDKVAKTSETHIVKVTTRLMLGKLHAVHKIYRSVVHSQIGVEEGTERLSALLKAPPIYPKIARCSIAFAAAFIICLLSFGGSVIDAAVAGCAGFLLAYLQLYAAPRSTAFANVFEISTALWLSFVARGLHSWQGDYFCYSAIQSAGVVLILPGFSILTAALDLVSKNFISGAARLVWAIAYTLFLGFSLTIGSDFWFLIDPAAREQRAVAASSLTPILSYNGSFIPSADDSTLFETLQKNLNISFDGAWTFVNSTSNVSQEYHYQIVGCYRDPSWQWWRRPFPTWTLFLLVPLYSLCSSSWNLQPFKSKQLPVMVAISCISYAARKLLQTQMGTRQEVVSAVGAFVIGVLGNIYARAFKGTAFTAMVTGVCFLIPTSLAATGGLALNYQGKDVDQYTSTIQIGVRMLETAVGTTVGLLTSSLVVYTFGPKKRSALFAF